MKRLALVLSLVIGTYSLAQAQYRYYSYPQSSKRSPHRYDYRDDFKRKSYLGFKIGGTHTALINNNQPVELGLAPDFQGGLAAKLALGGFLALQPEILYTQSTTKYFRQNQNSRITRSSVDVPILFRFSFGNTTQFFINAGAQASYALDTKTKTPGQPEQTLVYEKDDFNHRTGYGAAGGMGVAINSHYGQFMIEARGYYPMGDFANGWLNQPENRMLNVGLSIGYLGRLGR